MPPEMALFGRLWLVTGVAFLTFCAVGALWKGQWNILGGGCAVVLLIVPLVLGALFWLWRVLVWMVTGV